MRGKDLTTTSYAILGLLAIRPHSAYDLAKQMARSLHFIWPRAESAIYEEPKNLVVHGFASSSTESEGKRVRTVYSITASGRQAVAAWLATPAAPPALEIEPVLRVMLAEHGTLEDMQRTVESLRQWAMETRNVLLGIGRQYAGDEPPFPERAHVASLGGLFMHEYVMMIELWCDWVIQELSGWKSASTSESWRGKAIAQHILRRYASLQDTRPWGGSPPKTRPTHPTSAK